MCYVPAVALLSVHDLSLTFGGENLLESVQLHIDPGDRCCLVGRNGTGKSTLMKLIAGAAVPDAGRVTLLAGSAVAYLGQEIPSSPGGVALDVAAGRHDEEEKDPEKAAERVLEAEQVLTRLGVPLKTKLSTASGGVIRRVLLARALAAGADFLLLDEPTNHLDIETVLWLEEYLLRRSTLEKVAILFVTHDRAFAERLTTRVAELDRGELHHYPCGYREFLSRQEERLANEDAVRERFEQRLAEEEAWLAKGVKARRTRNEGRLRRLLEMRDQQRRRRERLSSASFGVDAATRSGDLVVETAELTFGYGEELLIRELSTTVTRGDRLGIVGPNGIGKSTLIKLLLGELEPVSGRIRRGSGLEIVYFDQMRSLLDPEKTVYDNVGDGYDHVTSGGRRRHILAYLGDFLFSRYDVQKLVKTLSGGERNRVLLAKLFARPANLLVLDEPTNDLDSDTLDLLEELLLEFTGTVVLVSHDRRFLDNVVTECLVFTGDGFVEEFVGGYTEWREKREAAKETVEGGPSTGKSGKSGKPKSARTNAYADRLSFKEVRELADLPDRIAHLEEELEEVHTLLANPEIYKGGGSTDPGELTKQEERLRVDLESAYVRWEELESRGAD